MFFVFDEIDLSIIGGLFMGLFSLFKKSKKQSNNISSESIQSVYDEISESVTTYQMMQEDEKKNGKQTKRNVVFQPEHITIKADRTMMTKGVPADYFFDGDENNKCGERPLLSPLKIDIEKAVKDGVPGASFSMKSNCILIAENDEYRFFNYGCFPDGSGGSNVCQKKDNPKQVLFFGKARTKTCIYHNKLVQINDSAYGTELYLFVKDITSGEEKIYPWFGKYAIPTGRGSRYDQDTILDMKVDEASDSIIINVQRQFYINPSPDDNEALCNADTNYVMTVKINGDDFEAVAEYSELNISVVFGNNIYFYNG